MLTILAGLGWIAYVLGLLGGLILVPLGFPGVWLIVLCAFFYSLVTDFTPGKTDFWVLFSVIVMAVMAELFEFGISVVGAKKFNVSNKAIVASIAGGLLGAMVGGLMIIVVGSLIGLLAGVFLGAFAYELATLRDWRAAGNAAMAVFFSRVTAIFIKTMVAFAMVVYVLTQTF